MNKRATKNKHQKYHQAILTKQLTKTFNNDFELHHNFQTNIKGSYLKYYRNQV